jgi:hypothetical protein
MGADVVVWQAQPTVRGPDRWLRNLALAAHGVSLSSSCTQSVVGDGAVTRVCTYCGHPEHGKPRLIEGAGCIFFNSSYAADLSLCAIGTGEVGIDVAETARLDALDLDAIDAATRGAVRCAARGLPRGSDLHLAWIVFEAVAKGLGIGLAARGADVAAALGSWSIMLYRPTTTTVACLATAIAAPTVVRATVAPSTNGVAVMDMVVVNVEAGGQQGRRR